MTEPEILLVTFQTTRSPLMVRRILAELDSREVTIGPAPEPVQPPAPSVP